MGSHLRHLVVVVLVLALLPVAAAIPEYGICTSPIYCSGPLLETVQMARLSADSKTFVDMKLKQSPKETLASFRYWQLSHSRAQPADIRRFVAAHFDAAGSELQPWTPPDWHAAPRFLRRIHDRDYARFAATLHSRWPRFGRRLHADVHRHPDRYSIIAVPHPVIVPGGRYREYYYWDAFWTQLGLQHGEMFDTVLGTLENFFSLVDRFGFVPNGGRIYYLGRSQPPLLALMCERYVRDGRDDAAGRRRFMRRAVQRIEREFAYWWDDARVTEVRGFRLSRYMDRSAGPRPESYWEDRQYGEQLRPNRTAERRLYAEFKACAESGMDFSSRWFGREEKEAASAAGDSVFDAGTLLNVKCREIVPVELNALLCRNAEIIAEFYRRLGNDERAATFAVVARELRNGVHEVFWNEAAGAWFDWDLRTGEQRAEFVATNLSPLWLGIFDRRDAERVAAKVLGYIERCGLDDFAGGVPTTLRDTGEQWDFPNAWPPVQHMLIEGLEALGTPEAQRLALRWAQRWVFTNYVAFNGTGAMLEKVEERGEFELDSWG